ncbi:MAG: hypothetical protein NVS9B1_06630 [Candidatus Dormibacteraceae bacterium]
MSSPPPPPIQAFVSHETRAYAEWYSWAVANLPGAPPENLAAAAQAAVAALGRGGDVPAAMAAAKQAVASDPGTPPTAAEAGYANWFVWATRELGLPQDRAHAAALAAFQAEAGGAQPERAAAYARSVVGLAAPVATAQSRVPWYGNGAGVALGYGIFSIGLPLLTGTHLIFIPAFGVLYSVRALARNPTNPAAIGGLVLNGLATAWTGARLLHLA